MLLISQCVGDAFRHQTCTPNPTQPRNPAATHQSVCWQSVHCMQTPHPYLQPYPHPSPHRQQPGILLPPTSQRVGDEGTACSHNTSRPSQSLNQGHCNCRCVVAAGASCQYRPLTLVALGKERPAKHSHRQGQTVRCWARLPLQVSYQNNPHSPKPQLLLQQRTACAPKVARRAWCHANCVLANSPCKACCCS
jgi:hypothetical protein